MLLPCNGSGTEPDIHPLPDGSTELRTVSLCAARARNHVVSVSRTYKWPLNSHGRNTISARQESIDADAGTTSIVQQRLPVPHRPEATQVGRVSSIDTVSSVSEAHHLAFDYGVG